MKRVGLKQQFHGEPDPSEEGVNASIDSDKDQVTLEIKRGTVAFRVPSNTPDDQVIQDRSLGGFLDLNLTLEDGKVLAIEISDGAQGVDARILPPNVSQTG